MPFININDVYLYYPTYKLKTCFNTLYFVVHKKDTILFTKLPPIIIIEQIIPSWRQVWPMNECYMLTFNTTLVLPHKETLIIWPADTRRHISRLLDMHSKLAHLITFSWNQIHWSIHIYTVKLQSVVCYACKHVRRQTEDT